MTAERTWGKEICETDEGMHIGPRTLKQISKMSHTAPLKQAKVSMMWQKAACLATVETSERKDAGGKINAGFMRRPESFLVPQFFSVGFRAW